MAKNTVLAKVTVGWQSILVECTIETLQALQQARQIESRWIGDKSVPYFSEAPTVVELFLGGLPMSKDEMQRLEALQELKKQAETEATSN